MSRPIRHDSWNVDNHRHTLAAASSPLLVGLGIAALTAVLLAIGGPYRITDIGGPSLPHTIALVAALVMLTLLVAAALLAVVRRLPVWVYPWIGTILVGLTVALNLVAEDRAFVLSPRQTSSCWCCSCWRA